MTTTRYTYSEAQKINLEQELQQLFGKQYSHWQSQMWAEVQSGHAGFEWPSYYVYKKQGDVLIAGVGYRRVLKGELHWIYFPRGPLVAESVTTEDLDMFMKEVVKSQSGTCVWVRLDPNIEEWPDGIFEKRVLTTSHKEFHPTSTQVVDLTCSADEILGQMKPKGRYNIRLAQKKEVRTCILSWDKDSSAWKVVESNCTSVPSEPLQIYHEINNETTSRDGFAGHKKEYYEHMLRTLGNKGCIVLAEYDGMWIAGAILLLGEKVAYYYYGASSNAYRKAMAPYLVQWVSMRYAKSRGCVLYDFLGIADERKGRKDPLWGVTNFKKKFGGKSESTVGTWEYVGHSFWYNAIKVRKWLHRITSL